MSNRQLQYAQEHNLTDTLISLQILRQCRPDLPERKEVGTTKDGLRILFEETQGSLLKRHYKYTDSEHATSWYLIYIENGQAKKVDEKWLESQIIDFNNDFDIEILTNYLKSNNRRFNALDNKKSEKKQRSIWLTDDEYEYVLTFVEKMRRIKGENTQN